MNPTSRILYIAIHRNLQFKVYTNFTLRTHAELDLENQVAVRAFFEAERPDSASSPPSLPPLSRLLCIYPKHAPPQPMKEEHLLTSELEPTNEPYAVAKIAGIKLCQSYNRRYGTDFISVMPTNPPSPPDGTCVAAWGTGNPRREFLFSDACADACVFLIDNYPGSDFVNIGTSEDLTIRELTEMVALAVGYRGEIRWDHKAVVHQEAA